MYSPYICIHIYPYQKSVEDEDDDHNGVQWTCCQCTLVNEGYATECVLCGALLADNIPVEIEEVHVDKPWRCRQCTLWNEVK
jgi:hypothetical protein